MCNLNIFVKSSKSKSLDLVSFLDSATKNSYLGNPDGDGVYFNKSNSVTKTTERLNYLNFMKEIEESPFILSHQRISTSGKTEEYTQPFDDKEFVLLHNGILRSFEEGQHSDTYNLFHTFLDLFNKDKTKNREKKIIKYIKTLLDNVSGSFSICLFDKTTDSLYYFKNAYSSIYAYRTIDKKELYFTTIKDNEKYLELYRKDFKEVEFIDYKIYKITSNGKVSIDIVGKLTKEKVCNVVISNTEKSLLKNNNNLSEIIFGYYGVTKYEDCPRQCINCGEVTTNWTEEGVNLCDRCLVDEFNGSYTLYDDIREIERNEINKTIEEFI